MVQLPKKLHSATPTPNRKGSPNDVPATVTLHREPSTKKVPIQIKVTAELGREFRVFCAARDLDLSTAFVMMFEDYRKTHGG